MSRSPRATRRTPDSWNCGSSANWTSRRRPSTSLQKPWRGERLPAPGPPEQPSAVAWLAPPPVVQTTPLSNRGPLSVRGRPCLRRRTGAVLAVRGPQTGDDPRGRLVLRESDPGHHFRRVRTGRWDLLDPRGIDHGFGGGDRGPRGHGGGDLRPCHRLRHQFHREPDVRLPHAPRRRRIRPRPFRPCAPRGHVQVDWDRLVDHGRGPGRLPGPRGEQRPDRGRRPPRDRLRAPPNPDLLDRGVQWEGADISLNGPVLAAAG